MVAKLQGVELRVLRASKSHATMFVMGANTDKPSGGFLIAEMERNIRYCASEKSTKIERVRTRYPQWWLALVDHIWHGLNESDQEMFRNQVSIEHDWDKIILIDLRDYTRWFEV